MLDKVGFFRLARRSSLESKCRVKVGAVLVKRRPISFGYNRAKSHPAFANPTLTLRTTIHAEMDCINGVSEDDLLGSTIYIYREGIDRTPLLARPCPNCMNELLSWGVSKIIYSISTEPYYVIERIKV